MAAIFIHGLIPTVRSAVLSDISGFSVIDANRKAACCQGCFRCWLASPGQCVMKDDLQTVGAQIGNCKNLFTRCLMPSFLFIPVLDAFMLLSALAHGNTLFRRHKRSAQEKGTHL